MSRFRIVTLCSVLAMAGSLLAGCGHKQDDKHAHEKEKAEGKAEGHGHEEGSPSGASFKAGKGIRLTEETRKILGVEVAEVTEQKLPKQVDFTVQVFEVKPHSELNAECQSASEVHASGLLPSSEAALVKTGQRVHLLNADESAATGVVQALQKSMTMGETEIEVGVSNSAPVLKPGDFLSASIRLPREEVVTVIPLSAVLRSSEGIFVYVVNGDAYLRTAVKIGSQANGFVEITNGLLAGDQVVTKPVETLWLIELRATKGGGHSH